MEYENTKPYDVKFKDGERLNPCSNGIRKYFWYIWIAS